MLRLEDVPVDQDFSWLQDLKQLQKIEIVGKPIDVGKCILDFASAHRLRELRLPAGSTVNRDDLKDFPGLKVYVGSKLVSW